jgi:hypothetical protein
MIILHMLERTLAGASRLISQVVQYLLAVLVGDSCWCNAIDEDDVADVALFSAQRSTNSTEK